MDGTGCCVWKIIWLILSIRGCEVGPLSHYEPNDGFNNGELACGGQYTTSQRHIAHRRVYKFGCGQPVLVCSLQHFTCSTTQIQDAGPYGADCPTRRIVWTDYKLPKGCAWRAIADLSYQLWVDLGRPEFRSSGILFYLSRLNSARGD
jgi:hypothetical protein